LPPPLLIQIVARQFLHPRSCLAAFAVPLCWEWERLSAPAEDPACTEGDIATVGGVFPAIRSRAHQRTLLVAAVAIGAAGLMAGVWQLMIADPSSLAGLVGGATMLAVGGWGLFRLETTRPSPTPEVKTSV
jgi:hypothetical protein